MRQTEQVDHPLPPPYQLIFTHIFCWIPGCGRCIQPQRGSLAKPRPTAWVRKFTLFQFSALKGRDKDHRSRLGDRPRGCQNAISPFQGLRAHGRGFPDPRPLAWAEAVRPFGARFGITTASTPGVHQKIWDTISLIKEGNCYYGNEGCV